MSEAQQAWILDSFALLAYVAGEAGAGRVQAALQDAEDGRATVYLSIINLGEALYVTERERGLARAQWLLAAVDRLPITVVPASRPRVLSAAHVKANFRLAYADAFAVVAAQEFGGVVLTGDPEFASVAGLIGLEWLER